MNVETPVTFRTRTDRSIDENKSCAPVSTALPIAKLAPPDCLFDIAAVR
jgi:hypothetical protein